MSKRIVDCLIVGGGPAGLTAAIYLARFHLSVLVADSGESRAALIPKTRNHAGFPEGISGPNLLRRMNQQARIYGTHVEAGTVTAIERAGERFAVESSFGPIDAGAVLLATGVVNNRPDMPAAMHDEALARGLIRYCPICDAFEVTDLPLAVIGTGAHGRREAIFLRGYTTKVTLIAPEGPHDLAADDRAELDRAGVRIVDGPAVLSLPNQQIAVDTPTASAVFASVYPALGSVVRSDLARAMGAGTGADGCLLVDAHQRTSIPGLYAAGDVVLGLDQISHAMGEGGVAATAIRNDFAARRPLFR